MSSSCDIQVSVLSTFEASLPDTTEEQLREVLVRLFRSVRPDNAASQTSRLLKEARLATGSCDGKVMLAWIMGLDTSTGDISAIVERAPHSCDTSQTKQQQSPSATSEAFGNSIAPPPLFGKPALPPHVRVQGLDLLYPMYVLPFQPLQQLRVLMPHQQLLRDGALLEVDPDMDGFIIFISHEWLSCSHPDPECKQLRVLQHIFGQLAKGEVDKIESHWIDQLVLQKNRIVDEWQKALPFMNFWWDFFSMPQPFAETAGTAPACQNHLYAEATEETQCLKDGLANAVASIPDV